MTEPRELHSNATAIASFSTQTSTTASEDASTKTAPGNNNLKRTAAYASRRTQTARIRDRDCVDIVKTMLLLGMLISGWIAFFVSFADISQHSNAAGIEISNIVMVKPLPELGAAAVNPMGLGIFKDPVMIDLRTSLGDGCTLKDRKGEIFNASTIDVGNIKAERASVASSFEDPQDAESFPSDIQFFSQTVVVGVVGASAGIGVGLAVYSFL